MGQLLRLEGSPPVVASIMIGGTAVEISAIEQWVNKLGLQKGWQLASRD